MTDLKHIRKSFFELLIRVLFVVLPTMAISGYVLNKVNLSYTGFDSGTTAQFIFIFAGILLAYVLAWMNGRFLVLSVILLIIAWLGKVIVENMAGELDLFYAQAKYFLLSTLFVLGWITGFLIGRSRLFVVIYCSVLMLVFIIFFSQVENVNVSTLTIYLLPVFVYTLYMLFLAPQLMNAQDWNGKKLLRWSSLVILFVVLTSSVFYLVEEYFRSDLELNEKIIEARKGDKDGKNGDGDENGMGQGYNEKNGLLERGDGDEGGQGNEDGDGEKGGKDPKDGDGDKGGKDPKDGDGDKGGKDPKDGKDGKDPKDGKDKGKDKGKKSDQKKEEGEDGYRLKDSMKMGEQQSKSDVLMFCARLDNFFNDGSPKPLYFVYHYLTKYDVATETFVRDPLIPFSDEIAVDPSQVNMYRSKTDSAAIKNSFADKKRKVVEADVFISASVWRHSLLAPSAAFSIMTIPVDTGYKNLFRSGYHVKSWVSDLNNAYFVYNPSANPQILAYQEERNDELRTVKNYDAVDSTYYAYYTQLPKGSLFDSIRNLAIRVTATAKTPADKVIAIRDYFLQTKADGSPLYTYTLDPGAPGDPNIPTGGMLRDFLFKSHAGYCTYYAGASTLMLQAVGVPARFTTGFATIDRSDKNRGWYWFYASQAHAWTQVFFPGYGWLDFDMTVSTEENGNSSSIGQAPKPDGTPPVPPPQPWLILDAIVTEEPVPNSGRVKVRFSDIIFFNDEYHLKQEQEREVDATLCRILYGKLDTNFSAIHLGDSIFVVSWDDAAKRVPDPDPKKSIEEQVNAFEWPMIADEIYMQKKTPLKKEEEKTDEDKKKEQEESKVNWKQIWFYLLIAAGVLLIGVVFFPLFYLLRFMMRVSGSPKNRAEGVYRLAMYTFHMSGAELKPETALIFATERIDPMYQLSFAEFVRLYLKLKYSTYQATPQDEQQINLFYSTFRQGVRGKLNSFKSIIRWFHLPRALRFFRSPEAMNEIENKYDEQ